MIEVKIKNIKQIRTAFKKAPADLARELAKAIKKSGERVEYEAKARGQSTGGFVKGGVMTPGARTTPVDTGTMARSIRARATLMESLIQPHVEYADYVHEGTRYMRGRPFMQWALERAQKNIDKYFEKALDNTLLKIKTRAR